MNGRSYWLIPFLFAIIYIETGFIVQSYEGIFVFLINGQPSLAVPNNYLVFYNTAHGPFSSIFLSNFIFDGFGNLIAFMIYSMVFIIAVMYSPYRMQRAWQIVIGSVLAGILSGAIIRFFLVGQMITYGQSAVLSGFAGIALFFAIYEFIKIFTEHKYKLSAVYFAGFVFFFVFGIASLYGFFVAGLSIVTIEVHAIALIIGVVLAGIFLLTERSAGRGRKAPLLITAEEGTELTGGSI